MPRVKQFRVKIVTGGVGTPCPPRFSFNGHVAEFENSEGNTDPGATFEGSFAPSSFAHAVHLQGPDSGKWEISRITVTYDADGGDPYEVTFGPVELDETNALNIWKDRPLPTFDV